jgi:putative spermidine/putrescine transport system substrate-binding protein
MDTSKVNTSQLLPQAVGKYGYQTAFFMFVMAWNQDKIPDSTAPQSWTDFWDTTRYKTKRSLYQVIDDGSILEAALLADGVPPSQIYPLDVDRALRSLDRLGKKNIIWHSTNAEPIQQLESGAVNLSTAFNGRIMAADKAGAHLSMQPRQSVIAGDYWPVLKGSQHASEAWELLNFVATHPDADAQWSQAINYFVPNLKMLDLLPPNLQELAPFTSSGLKPGVIFKDSKWWSDNLASTLAKFTAWQAS